MSQVREAHESITSALTMAETVFDHVKERNDDLWKTLVTGMRKELCQGRELLTATRQYFTTGHVKLPDRCEVAANYHEDAWNRCSSLYDTMCQHAELATYSKCIMAAGPTEPRWMHFPVEVVVGARYAITDWFAFISLDVSELGGKRLRIMMQREIVFAEAEYDADKVNWSKPDSPTRVATALGISLDTLHRRIDARDIRVWKITPKSWSVYLSDVRQREL